MHHLSALEPSGRARVAFIDNANAEPSPGGADPRLSERTDATSSALELILSASVHHTASHERFDRPRRARALRRRYCVRSPFI